MQIKKKDARQLEQDYRDSLQKVKREAGLVEIAKSDFAVFFANWKSMHDPYLTLEDRRGRLRWLLRKLHEHLGIMAAVDGRS